MVTNAGSQGEEIAGYRKELLLALADTLDELLQRNASFEVTVSGNPGNLDFSIAATTYRRKKKKG